MEKVQCSNCHCSISSTVWELHEATCSRHCKYCDKCRMTITKIDWDEHCKLLHPAPIQCECGILINASIAPQHANVSCNYCEIAIKRCVFSEHEKACGSRTEQCNTCNEWVKLSNISEHSCIKRARNAKSYTTDNSNLNICPYCMEPKDGYAEIQEHILLSHPELLD